MQKIVDYFLGTCSMTLSGPWPAHTLNHLTAAGVRFWNVRTGKNDTIFFVIYRKDLHKTTAVCEADGCKLQGRMLGFQHGFRGLKKRFALFVLVPMVIVFTLFLQNFIWYLEVEGNEVLADEQILQALESIGIHPGAYIRRIDPQMVKNHMLQLLPELEWISVNKQGGRAMVLVQERREKPALRDPHLITNVVAARAGVITDMQVYAGFPVVEVGDSVLEGELLVSGLGSSWNAVVSRNASADVFAYTRHETELITPCEMVLRGGEGQEKTRWSIFVGKKCWNFFQDSGISLTGYDKIERVFRLSLPGSIVLPVGVVKTTLRYYEPVTEILSEEQAEVLLAGAEQAYLCVQMVQAEVLDTTNTIEQSAGVWRLRAVTAAKEMIARAVTIDPWSNGEYE